MLNDPPVPQVLEDVIAEMKHRALDGCSGTHDGTCCDPEVEIHPEDWCNRCLMGVAVKAHEEGALLIRR